jgi:non-ribosomal peptide synthetase component E (peptide arylation enzyme)
MMTPEASLPLVARAAVHADRIAVAAPEGTFRYRDLLDASAAVAARLLRRVPATPYLTLDSGLWPG